MSHKFSKLLLIKQSYSIVTNIIKRILTSMPPGFLKMVYEALMFCFLIPLCSILHNVISYMLISISLMTC